MSKYNTLITILDEIRKEAPGNYTFYHPLETEDEKLNKARSRAYIHLFLKVRFGLLTFEEREYFVTDGTNDGGVDGYYIDNENKKIYFIQSKFRDNQLNFESREIKYEELINMDIDRITDGEKTYENGSKYNDKIQKLIQTISTIPDIGRYKYEIIIIANTKVVSQNKLKKLSDGNPVQEFNFERAYKELVFPVICGTYYDQKELIIEINLSNKTSEEISYSVETEFTDCQITALFIPTLEIAKTLYKYKNSILKYNPRSYLDMKSGTVNSEIANTLTSKDTNEFALYNNGITMLSDDTNLNKKIAKKGIGQLIIANPQIINGGQTAFTLSRIYEDCLEHKEDLKVFEGKEVLLKIITFNETIKDGHSDNKLKLIEAISKATNQQTTVSEADRRSNDKIQIELQNLIFDEFGYFYQRKAGEFSEGIKNKYIDRKKIIDREVLLRLILACQRKPTEARRSGGSTLFKKNNFDKVLKDTSKYKSYINAYFILQELNNYQIKYSKDKNNKDGIINFGHALRYGKYAVISAIIKDHKILVETEINKTVNLYLNAWLEFEKYAIEHSINSKYFLEIKDSDKKEKRQILNFDGFYKGTTLNKEISDFDFKTIIEQKL
ncbi:AIPR family protein [Myroides sp. N17-2]|uniref:AIPR family protein n=1 Tax=Myroides sp. N17-2 TaxID=2030799 RepID=UPI000EFAD008|nr:AIPR family protein [Myroides sp. N17-2]